MNEESLFAEALELTPAERAPFLAEACGADVALRQRLDALLAAHDRAGDFLESPVAGPAPDAVALGVPADPSESPTNGMPPVGSKALLALLEPPGRPNSLGRLGHYEALEILGEGGFGIVIRAFDVVLERVVAIKVLAPQLAATSPARKRFLREARSSAAVRHENVVQIHAVEEQPLPYLVMEFIPGETLQQRLDRMGPLETTEIVRIGRQIAEGLAAAHATGLIHRDIKPANVILEAGVNRLVKLTDFGLARAADDASMSQSGQVAGTPMYMSPEQARGDRIDHRSDLFSLGSVLYTMCSGRPPFRAENALAVLRRVVEDKPRPIPEVIPETPSWLCDIVARLHAKNPERRIQSARKVAELLSRDPSNDQHAIPYPWHATRLTAKGEKGNMPAALAGHVLANPRPNRRRLLVAAAAAVLLLFLSLSLTEATGVTKLRGAVVRLFTAEGTLVVETDDPDVRITIDGEEMVITGAGVKELRVRPGQYTVKASKDGLVVCQEFVTVEKNGRQVVRISRERAPIAPGSGVLDFDGATSYVDIPSLSRDDDGPITIEAFVTVGGVRGAALVRIEGKYPCQLHGWPGRETATWVPNAQDHRGTKMNAAETPPLTPGKRAHVAVQFDSKSIQLFIDGRRVNACVRNEGIGDGQLRGTQLGVQWENGRLNHHFSGKLREVRISKALRYDGDFSPPERFAPDDDTVALYHCDEGGGEKLLDSSPNGHHGRIVGARWVRVE